MPTKHAQAIDLCIPGVYLQQKHISPGASPRAGLVSHGRSYGDALRSRVPTATKEATVAGYKGKGSDGSVKGAENMVITAGWMPSSMPPPIPS